MCKFTSFLFRLHFAGQLGGTYGTGCNFEGGGVRVSLGKITKIRAFPHPVPYKPPDPILLDNACMKL